MTASLQKTVARLDQQYADADTPELLRAVLLKEFPQRIAVVSSFGTEAAVLLDLVATINPHVPVLFIDTAKLFPQTLDYKDRLVARLGLTDVRVLRPDRQGQDYLDPEGSLWRTNPDGCCFLRKTMPLETGLAGFDAWISGRKRYHGAGRSDLPLFEVQDGRVKINPLAGWTQDAVEDHLRHGGLPPHPLAEAGYRSVGCYTCTRAVADGEAVRAGRWAGLEKTECGIHNRP